MPRIPPTSGQKAVKAFERAGFVHVRTTGSHFILKKEGWPNRLSVPVHPGKTVNRQLLEGQVKDAGLTNEQFIALL